MFPDISDLNDQVFSIMPAALTGSVVRTMGMTVAIADFPAPIGAIVEVQPQAGAAVRGEVVGFHDDLTLVYPFGRLDGIRRGNRARLVCTSRFLRVGQAVLGRILDAHGNCVDGLPQPHNHHRAALDRSPPTPTERPPINQTLATGVRSIDGLLTCGLGQRIGIFSGSGVGKSMTLGMIARYTTADVIVIALIGERGREVNEFIQRDLGQEGLSRAVIVVATADEPAILRVQSALTATSVAEHFRDQGKNVLLLMDSITRFAMAQREIGLAAGEPPTTHGYPPSVFGLLPRLVERAGRTTTGSITALYSVLVEGDDLDEPISDAVRGLLDGHIVLSRKFAMRGHYPPIDVLKSLSRLMPSLVTEQHLQAATIVREALAIHRDHEDLISVGAYRQGTNPAVDTAIRVNEEINQYLRQSVDEPSSLDSSWTALQNLAARCRAGANVTTIAPTDNDTDRHDLRGAA